MASNSSDTQPGQTESAANALGNALANAADWQGSVDVDAILRELRARGWRLVAIPPDHPDHPSKQKARDVV